MASFPALIPSSRVFTPGEYPATAFSSYSGVQNRVRHSNVFIDAQLRLTFLGLTQSEMLDIWNHYNSRRGQFRTFTLPPEVVGTSDITSYVPGNYFWRYAGPGTVEDLPCGEHNVSLVLETDAPYAATVIGAQLAVSLRLAAGDANGGSYVEGIEDGLSLSLAAGDAFTAVNGATLSVSIDIETGSASGDISVMGIGGVLFMSLSSGNASTFAAAGIDEQIVLSLAAGAASAGSASARYWRVKSLVFSATDFLEISEWQLLDSSNTVLSGGITPTSSNFPPGGLLSNLSDGSTTTRAYWPRSTAVSESFWIKYDLGISQVVSSTRFGSENQVARAPTEGQMEWSSDDITWTSLAPFSGLTYSGSRVLSNIVSINNGA